MSDTGISVLVLYENFAVATVLLTRLLDMPMVHMVRAESVSACDGSYDVVVVDPYLRAHRRAEVLRRWAAKPVLELCDLGGGAGVEVLCGEVVDGPGQAVMSALRLPSIAV
jgi:hypothetical protein